MPDRRRWIFAETGAAIGSTRRPAVIVAVSVAVAIGLAFAPVGLLWLEVFPVLLVFVTVFGYRANRLVGLRVDATEIRVGDVARAERREARGGSAWPARQSALRSYRGMWATRLDAVRGAAVLDHPDPGVMARLRTVAPQLPGVRERPRRMGFFFATRAPAHLLLLVDLSGARVPALAPTMWRGYVKVSSALAVASSNLWAVPTRRPEELRAVIAQLGLPPMELPDRDSPPMLPLSPTRPTGPPAG